MAYHANVERLRAEQMLDAVTATSYPYLTDRGRSSWTKENAKRRRSGPMVAIDAANPTAGGRIAAANAPFTVDGQPVDKHGLVRWLAATFGLNPFGTVGTAFSDTPDGPVNGRAH